MTDEQKPEVKPVPVSAAVQALDLIVMAEVTETLIKDDDIEGAEKMLRQMRSVLIPLGHKAINALQKDLEKEGE